MLKKFNRKISSNIYIVTISILVISFTILSIAAEGIGYYAFNNSYTTEYYDSVYKSALVASKSINGLQDLDFWDATGSSVLKKARIFLANDTRNYEKDLPCTYDENPELFSKAMLDIIGITNEDIESMDIEKLISSPYLSFHEGVPQAGDDDYYQCIYDLVLNGYTVEYSMIMDSLNQQLETQDLSELYIIVPDKDYKHFYRIIDCPNKSSGNEGVPFRTRYESLDMEESIRNIYETGSEKEYILTKATAHNKTSNFTAMVPIFYSSFDDQGNAKDPEIVGILCAVKTQDKLTTVRKNFIRGVTFTTVVLLIIITLICVTFIRKRIITPLELVSSEAERFAHEASKKEDLNLVKKVGPISEIRSLASALEKMEDDTLKNIEEITTMTRNQERVGYEFSLASQIQQGMLPEKSSAISEDKRYDVQAKMVPAKEVGGDFYDFFMIDENHIAILIADVSDKGVAAALFMAITKTLIKSRARLGGNAAEIISYVDETISEKNTAGMFVTVWLGIIDLETGHVNACNAGHDYPALLQSTEGYKIEKGLHGSPIGFLPGMSFPEYNFTLKAGDRIFLYTDGLNEAKRSDNERFGIERMLSVLNENKDKDHHELIKLMKKSVDDFAGDEPQFDDITMLSFEYFGTK